MKIKETLSKIFEKLKYLISIGVLIGSVFLVRWWGIEGMVGFIVGSASSMILLMKRSDKFTLIYKLIGGDKTYTDMLLGKEKPKVDRTKDIYSED